MIPHPPTFVLIGLNLALVAMFVMGFYWHAPRTGQRPPKRHALMVFTARTPI